MASRRLFFWNFVQPNAASSFWMYHWNWRIYWAYSFKDHWTFSKSLSFFLNFYCNFLPSLLYLLGCCLISILWFRWGQKSSSASPIHLPCLPFSLWEIFLLAVCSQKAFLTIEYCDISWCFYWTSSESNGFMSAITTSFGSKNGNSLK